MRHLLRSLFSFSAIAFSFAAASAVLAPAIVPSTANARPAADPNGDLYDKLFPYYIESCDETRMLRKDGSKGGSAGHAVLYIKGLCRDHSAMFPAVRLCADGENDITNPDSGVGVSVNKEFSNINFEIIPTKTLFFYGNVTDAKLTRAKFEEAAKFAADQGLYDNVKLHDKYMGKLPAGASAREKLEYVVHHSIDTDFGLAYARNSYCARVPLKKEMLPLVRDYLNTLNGRYFYENATKGLEYNWNGMTNNCTHLTHNGVASLGFMPFVATSDSNGFEAAVLGDVRAPRNEIINLMKLTNRDFDVVRDFRDPYVRDTFEKYHWLPNQHGSVMEPIYGYRNNEIYVIQDRSTPAPGCIADPKCAGAFPHVEWFFLRGSESYTTLRGNLKAFEEKYVSALSGFHPLERAYEKSLQGDEKLHFALFKKAYFQYLDEQLKDVREKLARLR